MTAKLQLVATATQLAMAYDRYLADDQLGRKIVCYLSAGDDRSSPCPLIVYVQGSNPSSHFIKQGGRVFGFDQDIIRDLLGLRSAHVLVVERPGVQFLEQAPVIGTARGTSEEYRQEHALPRWLEALRAAVEAAWRLDFIDSSRTLVVGHSEGSQVAAHLSTILPVSHVACLCGSDFNFEEMGIPTLEMTADPESLELHNGHTFKYWMSWLRSRPLADCLLASQSSIYLAHGTADQCSSIEMFDRTCEELRARGRPFMLNRLEGADHGLDVPPMKSPQGIEEVFKLVLDWFQL